VGLFAVFIACLPSIALGQEQPRTVTGTVVDAANRPVSGVLVFVDEESGLTITGAVGSFRLGGLTPGTRRLSFRKKGYGPRTFRLTLEQDAGNHRDIGVISLEAGPDPTATFAGRVLEGGSGQPVEGAGVELNGNVVAVRGGDGRFRASRVPITWGSNQIQVSRLSYLNETSELWIADPNETIDLSVTLHPEPIEVGGVVVEGDRRQRLFERRMRPFYERRERGSGDFFTRSEIEERGPVEFTDLLRRVPGVVLTQNNFSVQIRFSRAMRSLGGGTGCSSPLIFLDGALIGGAGDYVNLDNLVRPDEVEGIEVYKGPSQIPPQFNMTGSACGVIVIWTRQP
jgi:hypothetical protein